MKKILLGILLFTLFLSIFPNAAKIDEKEIQSTMINGVTMAPLSDIAKIINLDFSGKDGVYSVKSRVDESSDLYMQFSVSREKMDRAILKYSINGGKLKEEEITLSEKATFIDGKLYVPFRDVLEYFDARVDWTEEAGAYAYMKSYGKEVVVRTDGNVRQVVSDISGFEDITIIDGYFYYIKDGKLIKRAVETGKESDFGPAGKIHKS
jgi:hypothetical protein